MSSPTINLIDIYKKNPYEQQFTSTGHFNGFAWAKATRTDDPNTFEIMQGFVGCKDYVMDTQFRDQSYFRKSEWTEEQLRDNCIIVYTSEVYIKQLQQNLDYFLNPLEEKNELTKTTIKKIDQINDKSYRNNYSFYVIYGDNKWNIHGFAWSNYLSLIRAMAFCETQHKSFATYFAGCDANERSYWSSVGEAQKKWFKDQVQYLSFLLKPIPEGYNKYTGWVGNAPGHGSLGFFYLSGQLRSEFWKVYKELGVPYNQKAQYFADLFIQEQLK